MQVPTLLVGLGGIGSHVVDQIYGMVPPERRTFIAAHTFDTNVNDISQLDHLRQHVVQTSTDSTVRQYVNRAGDSVQRWFPDLSKHPALASKNLTEGAGQVRSTSRLAYRSAIEAHKLAPLEQQVKNVFAARGGDLVSSVRVMIVSSLTGGTGAGIFLQTALYLRWLLRERFSKNSILVRGAFVLPDALLASNAVERTKAENLQANAYACFKELEALARPNGPNIEMEVRPNQSNPMIDGDQPPYDFCVLYDFENTKGENLRVFENYLEQVIRTVHLQLFTPVGAENFSVEDNQIIDLVQTGGRSRYCGAGVATLEYPYEDMLDYCALRWATDNLSNQWLRVDELFYQEKEDYERDQEQGLYREEPELADRYVRLIDELASGDNPEPFFRNAHRSAHMLDDRGRPVASKAERFVEAVEQEIKRRVEQDREVARIADAADLQHQRLEDREHALRHVQDVEAELHSLRDEVGKAIDENKTFLINEVLYRDGQERGGTGGQDYRLNTWMLGVRADEEPLHPVAVRYVLYQMHTLVSERLSTLAPEVESLRKSARKYDERFDDPETENIIETPEDVLREALEQGFWRHAPMTEDEFEAFTERYAYEAPPQLSRLKKLYRKGLTERVLGGLQKGLDELIDDWERFFGNLGDVRNRLRSQANGLAQAHEDSGNPTRRFALAAREDKERLWENVRRRFTSNTLPPEIARQMYLGHYNRFCRHRQNRAVERQTKEGAEERFRSDVVAWCRDELRGVEALDLNIFQAMAEEAQQRGVARNDHITEQLESLKRLSRPFVPDTNDASQLDFWGLHPDALDELQDSERKQWLQGKEVTDSTDGASSSDKDEQSPEIEDVAFSPHELVRYRAHYGLTLDDFPKLRSGHDDAYEKGPYYRAYEARVRKMTGRSDEVETSITPHLDKRWHLPVYLPDLVNPEASKEEQKHAAGALLRGLAHGFFEQVHSDRREIWQYNGPEGPERVRLSDGAPAPALLHRLHDALLHAPGLVERVVGQVEQRDEEDRREYPVKHPSQIARHGFQEGCRKVPGLPQERSLLDYVFSYAKEAPSVSGLRERSNDLLGHFLSEVARYYRFAYGADRQRQAENGAANLIEKLRKESDVYDKEASGDAARREWDALIDRAVSNLQH